MWEDNKYILTSNAFIELIDGCLHFNFKGVTIITDPEYKTECNQFILHQYNLSGTDPFESWKFIFLKTMMSVERIKDLIDDLY